MEGDVHEPRGDSVQPNSESSATRKMNFFILPRHVILTVMHQDKPKVSTLSLFSVAWSKYS